MGAEQKTVRLRLRDGPVATREVRAAVDRVADRRNLSGQQRFELKLAATEAVTNALRGPSQAVEVAISGDHAAVVIEVTDVGRFTARPPGEQPLEAESGRGIPLMLALVDEVEFLSTSEGTRVRMRKRIPPADDVGRDF
jgi:anti-sigma regulatory factor (Ser/Thr protein kinase)